MTKSEKQEKIKREEEIISKRTPIEFWIENNITDHSIQEIIFKFNLLKKSRETQFLFNRYCFIDYLRVKKGFSLQKIGSILKKNHSTIMHSIRKFENYTATGEFSELKPDKDFIYCTQEIRKFLSSK